MTDAHPSPDSDTAGDHDDDHGTGHGHEDQALGPVDVAAWGAGLLGLAIGGVTALAYAVSTGYL